MKQNGDNKMMITNLHRIITWIILKYKFSEVFPSIAKHVFLQRTLLFILYWLFESWVLIIFTQTETDPKISSFTLHIIDK